jgi:hypothetical protein
MCVLQKQGSTMFLYEYCNIDPDRHLAGEPERIVSSNLTNRGLGLWLNEVSIDLDSPAPTSYLCRGHRSLLPLHPRHVPQHLPSAQHHARCCCRCTP